MTTTDPSVPLTSAQAAATALRGLLQAELGLPLSTLASPRALLEWYLRQTIAVVPGANAAAIRVIGEDGADDWIRAGDFTPCAQDLCHELPALRGTRYVLHVRLADAARDGDATTEGTVHDLLAALTIRLRLALAFADKVANLESAMATRQLIGQATGVLMERHRIGSDTAFDRLVRASQQAHLKLREVAHRVVETGLDPAGAAAGAD